MNKLLLSLLLSCLALAAAPLAAQTATATPPVQPTRPAAVQPPGQPTAPAQATPPAQAARPAAAGGCLVAQFKTVTLSQNDVEQRIRQAQDWLLRNIGRCSTEQLSAIRSNSPSWLGHALTPQLSGLIEGAIEAKASNSPALMAQLYESLGREGTASVVTLRNPPARAPWRSRAAWPERSITAMLSGPRPHSSTRPATTTAARVRSSCSRASTISSNRRRPALAPSPPRPPRPIRRRRPLRPTLPRPQLFPQQHLNPPPPHLRADPEPHWALLLVAQLRG